MWSKKYGEATYTFWVPQFYEDERKEEK